MTPSEQDFVDEALDSLEHFVQRQDVPPEYSTLDSDLRNVEYNLKRAKRGLAKSHDGLQVVASDERTLDVDPDAPFGDRLGSIERQLRTREVITTADAQAIADQFEPILADLADVITPIRKSFGETVEEMAKAATPIFSPGTADDSESEREPNIPEHIREARRRRDEQREREEKSVGIRDLEP